MNKVFPKDIELSLAQTVWCHPFRFEFVGAEFRSGLQKKAAGLLLPVKIPNHKIKGISQFEILFLLFLPPEFGLIHKGSMPYKCYRGLVVILSDLHNWYGTLRNKTEPRKTKKN